MLYEHTDLLSYDDIDRDVDGIFRAFCDTTLIEYAKDEADNAQQYWAKVVDFRRENLSPYDRPDFLCNARTTPPAENAPRMSRVDFEHVQGFLYWFDVRADYWSRKGADQKLIDILVPAIELKELYRHAATVQERIHRVAQLPGASDNWSAWRKNTALVERITQKAARSEAAKEPALVPAQTHHKSSSPPPSSL